MIGRNEIERKEWKKAKKAIETSEKIFAYARRIFFPSRIFTLISNKAVWGEIHKVSPSNTEIFSVSVRRQRMFAQVSVSSEN